MLNESLHNKHSGQSEYSKMLAVITFYLHHLPIILWHFFHLQLCEKARVAQHELYMRRYNPVSWTHIYGDREGRRSFLRL